MGLKISEFAVLAIKINNVFTAQKRDNQLCFWVLPSAPEMIWFGPTWFAEQKIYVRKNRVLPRKTLNWKHWQTCACTWTPHMRLNYSNSELLLLNRYWLGGFHSSWWLTFLAGLSICVTFSVKAAKSSLQSKHWKTNVVSWHWII